jgi:hypothetical protein
MFNCKKRKRITPNFFSIHDPSENFDTLIEKNMIKYRYQCALKEVNTLRFFWTFFWGFLLIHMASYVISSMKGITYDFVNSSILAVIAIFIIIIIGIVLPNEPVEKH